MLRRVPANRAGGAIGTTRGAGGGVGAVGAVPSASPGAPSSPSAGGAAPGGSAAGGSGVQEGTIGTPPPGPPLDCDVPILSLPLDGGLHRPGHLPTVPDVEQAQRPGLVADLRNDVRLYLRRRPLA